MPNFNNVPPQGGGEPHSAPATPLWQREPVSPDVALAAFRQAAAARGVSLPPEVIADGEIHRCDTVGKNGDGDGAYLLHLDGLPAGGFQNWQDGAGWQDWHADPGRPLSLAEADAVRKRQDEDKAKRQAAAEARKAETAERADVLWEKGRVEAAEHPYLVRKGVEPHGTRRQDRSNNLLVPMRDETGELCNLQRIDAEGNKRYLLGGLKIGCAFTIGDPSTAPGVMIAEGFSTGASAHQATGLPVVVAFDAGNLLPVAEVVHKQFPNLPLVFLADDDLKQEREKEARTSETDGNVGLVKARAAAEHVNGWVALPQFGPERTEGQSDFNDVAAAAGPAEVRRQIEAALPWRRAPTRSSGIVAALAGPGTDVEITPPARTEVEIAELIKTLDRNSRGTEAERQTMAMAMRGLATLPRLDNATQETLLKQMSARTGVSLDALKKDLAALRREMGIRVVATPATTEVCRRYVFVKAINAFWDRLSRTVCELLAVRNYHASEMPQADDSDKPIDPLDVMLKGVIGGQTCDKADVITFVPGENEIFQEGASVALNVWTKPSIVPVKGDVRPFLDHLAYILDGERIVIDHVLDYLAHMVQKGAIKIKSTILIIGAEGIGKSAISEMMVRVLGEENCTTIEDSDLRSQFNEWMDGIQLVVINELMSIESRETMSRLKTYITDPWIRINRKKVQTYRYRNRVNFMLFSNYEDAARIDKGDRRYLIWKSRAVKREQAYYDGLWHWFDNGGAEALLFFLQERDLSKFKSNAAPPDTAGKDEVIADSRGAIEAYLSDLFEAKATPFRHDLVTVTDLIEYLADRKNRTATHKQVTLFLRKISAVPLGQKRLRDGTRPSIWAIRNGAEWAEVGEEQIKAAWCDIGDAPLSDQLRNALLGRT